MSVCLSVCHCVCPSAQPARLEYLRSIWYLHDGHTAGSVLKKVSERFDLICDRGGRKRVEKHVFLAFFSHFQSDLFLKGSHVIFVVCMGYYQVSPTLDITPKEVFIRFIYIWAILGSK